MTRLSVVAVGLLGAIFTGLTIGWVLQALLNVQIDRLDARVTVLAGRLDPVSPKEVLCGVSAQMRYLSETMNAHCETAHGTRVPPLAMPAVCVSNYAVESTPAPNPSTHGR